MKVSRSSDTTRIAQPTLIENLVAGDENHVARYENRVMHDKNHVAKD